MIYCHTVIHTGPPPAALHVVYRPAASSPGCYVYVAYTDVYIFIYIYDTYMRI